jgi:hypothetical protein
MWPRERRNKFGTNVSLCFVHVASNSGETSHPSVFGRGKFRLTASRLPDLLRFTPHLHEGNPPGELPMHIRTPDGEEMPVFGEDLAAEVARRYGSPVQMNVLESWHLR